MPTNAYDQEIGPPLPGWSPPPRPRRVAMIGRHCRLVPLDLVHADDLFSAYQEAPDGRDWTYLPSERIDDRAEYQCFVAAQVASPDPLHFAILVDGAARGTTALQRFDPGNGVIELGHVTYARALQRTPAGTEAVLLPMRRAFDLGYRRVEWKCDSLNAPSRRAALRYGFTFEGIFRNTIVTKGRSRDTAWFAMIDTDWPAHRDVLERWLAPDNFDADGVQIRSLASFRTEH